MKRHLRRWGAAWLLVAAWLGSWIAQFVTQVSEGDGWTLFLSATFENWQSEFLQLAVQVAVLAGLADKMLQSSKDDVNELKSEIRRHRKDL